MTSDRAARERDIWLSHMKVRMERLYARKLAAGYPREASIFRHATEQLIVHNNPVPYEFLTHMNKVPVTIDEFIDSDEFIGDMMQIWPTLMPDLRLMNPDVFTGEDACHEALLGGATGTGKTFLSQATIMYQYYLMTCFTQVHRLFRLSPATPIVFMLQSVSTTITKRVIYTPIRQILTSMPYMIRHCEWDKYRESSYEDSNNIIITPGQATVQALVGQAIAGGILDEVNFMQIIEASKQVPGPDGMGGKYDQAEVVYTNISRRRKRSMLTKGFSMGCLCVVSSTRYNGDFLDRRIREVEKFSEKNVLPLRRKQYEVAPPERYSGEKFTYMVSSPEAPGRVIEDHEVVGIDYPMGARLELVPIELKTDFLRDPEAAQRDYMGIATDAISPFIRRRQKINDAVSRARAREVLPLVESDQVVLATDGMPTFIPENFPQTRAGRNKSRWVHVDLSRSNDPCGVAMIRLDGFVASHIDNARGITTVLPKFTVELAVSIKPSVTRQIDIAEVRNWVLQMARDYELNIEGFSFDGFDSRETIQILRNSGIRADTVSMDRTIAPYEAVRDALYEDRLDIQPDIEHLLVELRTLEYYAEKDYVDHPPSGTKDVADCVAGALEKALQSRVVRSGMEVVSDDKPDPGNHQPPRFRVTRDRPRVERERTRR